MNILFAGDLHLIESELEEINLIFDELLIIKDKYCINKLILLGDSFDKISPTSKELDCFSAFLKKINIPTILIAANSHESTTPENSIVNHFGILKDNILVCKEYKDNRLFAGHFILNQSSKNYGGTVDAQTLKQFRYIVLGHGHNFETKNNWCQLGSIRYVDFKEDPKIPKKVGICLGYETDRPRWIWQPLNSPYPMVSLEIGKNIDFSDIANDLSKKKVPQKAQESAILGRFKAISDLISHLDQLNPKTKVRIVYKDYESYREFLPYYEKYNEKFVLFKDKKDFVTTTNLVEAKKENTSLKESLIKWIEQNKIDEEIKKILLEELK